MWELEDTYLRVLRPVLGLQGRPARPALGPIVPGLKARTFGCKAGSPGEAAARPATLGWAGRERPAAGRRTQGGSEEAAGREPGAAQTGRRARHPSLRPARRTFR